MSLVSIPRWDGAVVLGVRSKGSGVFAALDWRDLIFGSPAPPIQQKADHADSKSLRAFANGDRCELTKLLGHYTPLQSINSEDTVTWSVFSHKGAESVLYDLLCAAFGRVPHSYPLRTAFWKRSVHPETGSEGHGPEADVTISGQRCCYLVEAKWTADIDARQGRNRDRTQIDMRCASARATGLPEDARGVLVIAPAPDRYPHAGRMSGCFRRYFIPADHVYQPTESAMAAEARAITWEQVHDRLDLDPALASVQRYLGWRLAHLRKA